MGRIANRISKNKDRFRWLLCSVAANGYNYHKSKKGILGTQSYCCTFFCSQFPIISSAFGEKLSSRSLYSEGLHLMQVWKRWFSPGISTISYFGDTLFCKEDFIPAKFEVAITCTSLLPFSASTLQFNFCK